MNRAGRTSITNGENTINCICISLDIIGQKRTVEHRRSNSICSYTFYLANGNISKLVIFSIYIRKTAITIKNDNKTAKNMKVFHIVYKMKTKFVLYCLRMILYQMLRRFKPRREQQESYSELM